MNEIDIYLKTMKTICPEIEDRHLVKFKETLSIRYFKKGDEVFTLNQSHNAIIFVTSGLVRSYYIDAKGQEKNAWFIKEYEFLTDYPCFLSKTKSRYAFQCQEDVSCVVLPQKAIYEAYSEFSSIEKYGRLIAEEVVKMMQARIEDLSFLSAKERYKKVLKLEGDLVNRISIGQLASYIGIERQSLTRIRKELHAEK
ncbi:Crp/Fnr family transcriptional regulator [Saprospiraceae bacterium]|nr:Crp/Fnr family transcriptional regulator [Saprospiraceae bacterium]